MRGAFAHKAVCPAPPLGLRHLVFVFPQAPAAQAFHRLQGVGGIARVVRRGVAGHRPDEIALGQQPAAFLAARPVGPGRVLQGLSAAKGIVGQLVVPLAAAYPEQPRRDVALREWWDVPGRRRAPQVAQELQASPLPVKCRAWRRQARQALRWQVSLPALQPQEHVRTLELPQQPVTQQGEPARLPGAPPRREEYCLAQQVWQQLPELWACRGQQASQMRVQRGAPPVLTLRPSPWLPSPPPRLLPQRQVPGNASAQVRHGPGRANSSASSFP